MEKAGEHTCIKERTIAHCSRTVLLTCFPTRPIRQTQPSSGNSLRPFPPTVSIKDKSFKQCVAIPALQPAVSCFLPLAAGAPGAGPYEVTVIFGRMMHTAAVHRTRRHRRFLCGDGLLQSVLVKAHSSLTPLHPIYTRVHAHTQTHTHAHPASSSRACSFHWDHL